MQNLRKNLSVACRTFGVSRTVYYKYKKRYLTYGIEELIDKKRESPKMPNKVRKEIEEKVIAMAKKYPTYGVSKASK
ncbi:MAG: helix-turn-helix domain-containing protein [Actinobacteria bacterium]|nr:helix-turn-helix domain-containing protein [Actinomycetota bacterium]